MNQPRIVLPIEKVIDKVGVSKATIYESIKHEGFPKPIKIRGRSGWLEHEIDAWLDQLAKNREC